MKARMLAAVCAAVVMVASAPASAVSKSRAQYLTVSSMNLNVDEQTITISDKKTGASTAKWTATLPDGRVFLCIGDDMGRTAHCRTPNTEALASAKP